MLNKLILLWDFWAFRGLDIFFSSGGLKFKNGYWDTHYAKNAKNRTSFFIVKNEGVYKLSGLILMIIGVFEVKNAVWSFKTFVYSNSVQNKWKTVIFEV